MSQEKWLILRWKEKKVSFYVIIYIQTWRQSSNDDSNATSFLVRQKWKFFEKTMLEASFSTLRDTPKLLTSEQSAFYCVFFFLAWNIMVVFSVLNKKRKSMWSNCSQNPLTIISDCPTRSWYFRDQEAAKQIIIVKNILGIPFDTCHASLSGVSLPGQHWWSKREQCHFHLSLYVLVFQSWKRQTSSRKQQELNIYRRDLINTRLITTMWLQSNASIYHWR